MDECKVTFSYENLKSSAIFFNFLTYCGLLNKFLNETLASFSSNVIFYSCRGGWMLIGFYFSTDCTDWTVLLIFYWIFVITGLNPGCSSGWT
jgi:hypothetical protein